MTALVFALVLAACAGDGDVEGDPEGALQDALEELADYDGFELLFQFSADDTARAQALREDGFTEDELELLLTSSLLVRTTADADEGAAEFVLTMDDTAVAELRVLPDTDLYLRVDLDGVLAVFDDPEVQQQVDELTAQAGAFGFGDLVEAAESGDWVRITGLEQLLNLLGVTPPQEDEVDEDEAERLSQELSDAAVRFVDEDVTVSYLGEEEAGERVRATTDGASLRDFLDDLGRITASSDALAGMTPQDLTGPADELPDDAEVALDAWISGGRLTQLALDLGALDEEGAMEGQVLLVVGIDEFTGSVTAPDEATEIDLFGLLGGFIGGFGGFGDGSMDDGSLDDGSLGDDPSADDGEIGADEGMVDDGLDGEGGCLAEEDLDQMRELLEPEEQAELDEAIEMGIIPVC